MLLCLQANIHSLSGSTFFCPRLWMMLTLSKSRVHVWVTVPVSLSWLITAPAQNTDCINQATFLIPVYVLTIYPLLLVLSLLENLRETEIGAVMLEIFIPKIFFQIIFTKYFSYTFYKKVKRNVTEYWYQSDAHDIASLQSLYLSKKKSLDYFPQQIILCAMCRLLYINVCLS